MSSSTANYPTPPPSTKRSTMNASYFAPQTTPSRTLSLPARSVNGKSRIRDSSLSPPRGPSRPQRPVLRIQTVSQYPSKPAPLEVLSPPVQSFFSPCSSSDDECDEDDDDNMGELLQIQLCPSAMTLHSPVWNRKKESEDTEDQGTITPLSARPASHQLRWPRESSKPTHPSTESAAIGPAANLASPTFGSPINHAVNLQKVRRRLAQQSQHPHPRSQWFVEQQEVYQHLHHPQPVHPSLPRKDLCSSLQTDPEPIVCDTTPSYATQLPELCSEPEPAPLEAEDISIDIEPRLEALFSMYSPSAIDASTTPTVPEALQAATEHRDRIIKDLHDSAIRSAPGTIVANLHKQLEAASVEVELAAVEYRALEELRIATIIRQRMMYRRWVVEKEMALQQQEDDRINASRYSVSGRSISSFSGTATVTAAVSSEGEENKKPSETPHFHLENQSRAKREKITTDRTPSRASSPALQSLHRLTSLPPVTEPGSNASNDAYKAADYDECTPIDLSLSPTHTLSPTSSNHYNHDLPRRRYSCFSLSPLSSNVSPHSAGAFSLISGSTAATTPSSSLSPRSMTTSIAPSPMSGIPDMGGSIALALNTPVEPVVIREVFEMALGAQRSVAEATEALGRMVMEGGIRVKENNTRATNNDGNSGSVAARGDNHQPKRDSSGSSSSTKASKGMDGADTASVSARHHLHNHVHKRSNSTLSNSSSASTNSQNSRSSRGSTSSHSSRNSMRSLSSASSASTAPTDYCHTPSPCVSPRSQSRSKNDCSPLHHPYHHYHRNHRDMHQSPTSNFFSSSDNGNHGGGYSPAATSSSGYSGMEYDYGESEVKMVDALVCVSPSGGARRVAVGVGCKGWGKRRKERRWKGKKARET